MDYNALKELLEMDNTDFQLRVEAYLRDNYEQEAKSGILDEIASDVGVDRGIVELILDHNSVDWE